MSSAEKLYRNRKKIIADLQAIAKNIDLQYSVVDIVLFGSIARGDFGLYSDADVLIILEKSNKKRYFDRIPEFSGYFNVSHLYVDIFPYTDEEIRRMKKNNLFIRRALEEGISLLS
ncbi:MAG: nucleotidyltransferase domain-containing protein [Candidatus Heimdallarchaeota archaeon]|nr:nucleotidyltransferase domain-containing protein [Candidatus Heimdallarchaeota archaeon]